MGIFDAIKSRVDIEIKADIAQAKAAIKDLAKEQQEAAKKTVAAMEANSKATDLWVGRITGGIAIAKEAFAIASVSMDAFQRRSQLSAAASRADLKALETAAGGLRTQTELLKLAADGMNGRWRLTQKEMELVVKGMRGLELAGRDSAKVTESVGNAILKGEVEPLKELGLAYDEATAKVDKKRAALDALANAGRRAGAALPTDDARRMGVEFTNAMENIRVSIGRVVTALAPLASVIADITVASVDLIERGQHSLSAALSAMDNIGQVGTIGISGTRWAQAYAAEGRFSTDQLQRNGARWAAGTALGTMAGNQAAATGAGVLSLSKRRSKRSGGSGAASDTDPWSLAAGVRGFGEDVYAFGVDALSRGQAANDEASAARSRSMDRVGRDGKGGYAAFGAQAAAQIRESMAGLQVEQNRGILSQIFGTPSEITATGEALALASAGVNVMTGAFQAGFDAWITGSESFSKAFKRAIGESMRGLASEFLGQSIRHGLFALGSLAFGDVGGAAKHAAAAAAFGAGAVTTGVIAKQLGAGAPPPGAAAGAGRAAAGIGGGGGAGGGTHITMIVGDSLGYESPRSQANRFSQLAQLASRTANGSPGVSFE